MLPKSFAPFNVCALDMGGTLVKLVYYQPTQYDLDLETVKPDIHLAKDYYDKNLSSSSSHNDAASPRTSDIYYRSELSCHWSCLSSISVTGPRAC